MAAAEPKRVFSVTGAVILLAICAFLTLVALIDAVLRSGVEGALLVAPWPLLALWIVYVVGVASDIRADRTGVRVQNFLRRTWVSWARVKRIAVRWQLEITLDDGAIIRCLGGPMRSRSRRIGPERTREDSATQSHDGIAALHRMRAEAELRSDAEVRSGGGVSSGGEVRSGAEVTHTWDIPALAALVILAAWAVAAVVATH